MSISNPSCSVTKPCSHLSEYKLKHGSGAYKALKSSLKASPNGRTSVLVTPKCCFCFENHERMYLCLICSSVFCCHSPDSNHAILHANFKGHEIALDITRAELYCCVCCDQVYDPDFDRTVMLKSLGNLVKSENRIVSKKRKRLVNWSGVTLETDLRFKSCFPFGLRGLNNMGSTCFMNCVLQSLLHTPPFRNYFLGDMHGRKTCRRSFPGQICLPCDIGVLFSAVFSGDRTPYSPAPFLYSLWQHSENLASYEQQDAHEFFISVLDLIHEKEGKTIGLGIDDKDCRCIAHRVFSGLLRSDVTCTSCGFISTTYDPCVDISLDFGNITSTKMPNMPSKSTENTGISTLLGCLNLFTSLEKLGSDQKLYCENCHERRNSLKQMSIKKLPLVLCLHIKRFEHSSVKNACQKIDRYMQFPFSLDMRPYLSSSVLRNRFGNRVFAFEGDEVNSDSEFEVFAVVTHSGMLESGHYVTYLRLEGQWYKCDDAWITGVDEDVVRASQCYLLFYVQKVYCYNANVKMEWGFSEM